MYSGGAEVHPCGRPAYHGAGDVQAAGSVMGAGRRGVVDRTVLAERRQGLGRGGGL